MPNPGITKAFLEEALKTIKPFADQVFTVQTGLGMKFDLGKSITQALKDIGVDGYSISYSPDSGFVFQEKPTAPDAPKITKEFLDEALRVFKPLLDRIYVSEIHKAMDDINQRILGNTDYYILLMGDGLSVFKKPTTREEKEVFQKMAETLFYCDTMKETRIHNYPVEEEP